MNYYNSRLAAYGGIAPPTNYNPPGASTASGLAFILILAGLIIGLSSTGYES